MISIVNPRFFVPVHGERRHLVAHAALAQSMGIPKDNTFVLEDGDVLAITPDEGAVVDKVTAGSVFVDGRTMWDMDSSVFIERRRLAREGVVVVVAAVSKRTGAALVPPEIASAGFIELDESQEIFEKTSKKVLEILEESDPNSLRLNAVRARVRDSITKFLHKETGKRPTVLAVIEKV